MGLTGSGRKAAVLCTAVVLLGSLTLPAQAAPLPGTTVPAVTVPASPEIPSPEEIAAAKASESATADQVTRIDRLLADAAAAQEASFAAAMQANNAYGDALVTLEIRRDAATLASAKAASAEAEQAKTRKQVGQLAGDLYRNGGLNPALSTFVSGNGDTLQQAATLEAISASRSRAFEAAENAASAAKSLTAAAEDANRAADDAAKSAEDRKVDAERANAARAKAVSEAKAQRTVLVDQLASLRNTTVALESARVDALDRQRAQDRLAAVTAAAASQAADEAAAAQAAAAQSPAAQNRPAAQTPAAPAAGSRLRPAPAAPAPAAPAPLAPAPVRPAPVTRAAGRSGSGPRTGSGPVPGRLKPDRHLGSVGQGGFPLLLQVRRFRTAGLRLFGTGAERLRRGRQIPAAHGSPTVCAGTRARAALPGTARRSPGLGIGPRFLPRGDLPWRRARGPGPQPGRRHHGDGPRLDGRNAAAPHRRPLLVSCA